MPYIRLSSRASDDLRVIWSYVEAETQSPTSVEYPPAADRLLEMLHEVFQSLSNYPLMGRVSSISPELRVFSVKRYLIFYRPRENGIEIARVLHTAREFGLEHVS